MTQRTQIDNPYTFEFKPTPFERLMQNRILKVLVICSSYDYFMLEEDGRIDEQIFNEYVKLNLRYPPQFIQVQSSTEAFSVLDSENIDLVITMLSAIDIDSFELAKLIKKQYPFKPIILLTPFSREVSVRMQKHDLSAIDYVFSWLGHTDLLLAIIKLVEDKMNVDFDTQQGVQTIMLVEDSVRFYSSYLPNIYKIIFTQSLSFMTEGLNEHQRMLRMRGRPKILLARNFNEAISMYYKYKHSLLGVISDISYKKDGVKNPFAGIELARLIKDDDQYMPVLLQSSDAGNSKIAKEYKVGFLHKYSQTLLFELKKFITEYFAFGDFVFTNLQTGAEIARATDLKSLSVAIQEVPNDVLAYYTKRSLISKWLNARALFPLATFLREHGDNLFQDINQIRQFITQAISRYRILKSRGIIAKFYRDKYDESFIFARIGDGNIGGKARGLAFLDMIIKKHNLDKKYENTYITIPRTVVVSSEIFDIFMTENNLYPLALSNADDEEILKTFVECPLPGWVYDELDAFLAITGNPVAVRSSSLLEDSHYQPFAGVYSTYMIPNSSSDYLLNLKHLGQAIKCVYASAFFQSTKAYMAATANVIDEEKMSIVLQEVCGTRHNNRFYPTFSGVARSVNFYPIAPEQPEHGIVNIALGMGKQIVEGGKSLRFSPKFPNKILQLSTAKLALTETQTTFKAIDLSPEHFIPSVDEGINYLTLRIKDAEADNTLTHLISTYDYNNDTLVDGANYEGKKIITFANILKYNKFPLSSIMCDLLKLFETEMRNPVEIEFAVDLNQKSGIPVLFNLLQIRPIVDTDQVLDEEISLVEQENTIITSQMVMGNGIINDIFDIVYIKPETFNAANNLKVVQSIEQINKWFVENNKYYVLVGPGRWGSSDHWLGIPVKWAQISMARVIVESNLENYRIDPSQGTHFFQNLTAFRVGYFTINSAINNGFIDLEYLNNCTAIYEDDYLRHVRFNKQITVKIDGRKNLGVVIK